MFQQNKFPKLLEDSLLPATCPEEPVLEWAPPGHGDIYLALKTSGALDRLRDRGVRYLFVANIDNLGAALDTRLLGYFARHDVPFMMEAVERTPMDRKGGHIAHRKDGGMILREIAQAAQEDMELFQDVQRHQYFNSNNLWINLDSLWEKLDEDGGFMPLPLIRNRKRLRPKDDRTPAVVQLETAMGAAIAQFPGARAALVDHDRYRPVKKTDDLLLLWSDCYRLDTRFLLTEDARCAGHGPVIDLDDRFYGSFDQLKTRFARGAPSLLSCTRLRIQGDIYFEEGVRIEGDVTLVNNTSGPVTIEKDACIDQDRTW
jgi:UDP-N-acetylglucosamine pyrophosphorylase